MDGLPATAWRKSFITTDWRSSSQGSRVVDGFGVVCSIAAGRDVAAMADEGWSKSREGKVVGSWAELNEPNFLLLGLRLEQF